MSSAEGIKEAIENGKTALGIELGSTRIKAVLIGEDNLPIASGNYDWENQLVDNIWTYDLEAVWIGLRECYASMAEDVLIKYNVKLKTIGAIGISAMMHGYLTLDKNDKLLVPFRTWRNTITGEASEKLTKEFNYNIPQRWSIAHLYQAILNGEEHVSQINYMTTLSGYVHWKLTGKRVLGIGDASGMFPIDTQNKEFNKAMLKSFSDLIDDKGYSWRIDDILPRVLTAGEEAGVLTLEGARLLDPTGKLMSEVTSEGIPLKAIPLCPPEGDAGTGMTATNSVGKRTGNVSAGTSVFAMAVLEKELSRVYPEIDLVTTPAGDLVAMVHCNNCTSDLNGWVNLFKEFAESFGIEADMNKLYTVLYNKALTADKDCGGLLAYNYFSGEHITGFDKGRPLFVRLPDSSFNLANFMRAHLFTSLGALKIGMDILFKQENVVLDKILGHGGLFKTKDVGQSIMAAAINVPVTVMETAGEGGAWGIALLAAYMLNNKGEALSSYIDKNVFAGQKAVTLEPETEAVQAFNIFIEKYKAGFEIERAAIDHFN